MSDIEGRVAAGVITELVKQTVTPIKQYVTNKWGKSALKSEMELIDAYEKYLTKSKEKYSKIKTLLYKRTPKDLYSFYEDLNVRYENQLFDTSDIQNLFSIGDRLIITGTGGIGKSTMMKHFFQNSIDSKYLVPILIELRNLNDKYNAGKVDLLDYIYKSIQNFDFDTEKDYLEYSLESGKNLILFDGLDEVKNDILNDVILAIQEFGDKFNKCPIILTSRPTDNFIGWNNYIEVTACPLSKEQALSLINKLDFDIDIKDNFYKNLDDKLYNNYEDFASIPLLLTIMLITYDNNADIPNELHEFYEQAFSALFHTHDASKSGYKRDIETKLSYDKFKRVFSYFCFQSFLNSDYYFTEDKMLTYLSKSKEKFGNETDFNEINLLNDLTNSVCMLVKDGLEYTFSHRSFQEYFAAIYTVDLVDEIQQKLFNDIIQEKIDCFGSKYIEILEQLQFKRFNKNFIMPKAKIIKNMIDKEDYLGCLKFLFESVELQEDYMSLSLSNSTNIFIFEKVVRYQNVERGDWRKDIINSMYLKIIENSNSDIDMNNINFETFYELGLLEDLMESIYFIEMTKGFSEWVDNIENSAEKELSTEEFLSIL
ncbi:NACHT domain-containing protein [Lysinibacillus sp. 54212]|uniref:NACHT domain-containing protein n=1 Tax=Lysinibacillus sp. 54212 TaxID=3119829 RepID=UPI002FC5A100